MKPIMPSTHTQDDIVTSLNAKWNDPANWKLGVFYYCKSDPRIVVKKRSMGTGWTLNIARPLAIPYLLGLLATLWGALELLQRAGESGGAVWGAVVIGWIVIAIGSCIILANPKLYRHSTNRSDLR